MQHKICSLKEFPIHYNAVQWSSDNSIALICANYIKIVDLTDFGSDYGIRSDTTIPIIYPDPLSFGTYKKSDLLFESNEIPDPILLHSLNPKYVSTPIFTMARWSPPFFNGCSLLAVTCSYGRVNIFSFLKHSTYLVTTHVPVINLSILINESYLNSGYSNLPFVSKCIHQKQNSHHCSLSRLDCISTHFDIDNEEEYLRRIHCLSVISIAWSPTTFLRVLLAVGTKTGNVSIWHFYRQDQLIKSDIVGTFSLENSCWINSMTMSNYPQDKNLLLVLGVSNGTVYLYRLTNHNCCVEESLQYKIPFVNSNITMPISCIESYYITNKTLIGLSCGCTIHLIKVTHNNDNKISYKCFSIHMAHQMSISGLAFIDQGENIISCGLDGRICIWNINNFNNNINNNNFKQLYYTPSSRGYSGISISADQLFAANIQPEKDKLKIQFNSHIKATGCVYSLKNDIDVMLKNCICQSDRPIFLWNLREIIKISDSNKLVSFVKNLINSNSNEHYLHTSHAILHTLKRYLSNNSSFQVEISTLINKIYNLLYHPPTYTNICPICNINIKDTTISTPIECPTGHILSRCIQSGKLTCNSQLLTCMCCNNVIDPQYNSNYLTFCPFCHVKMIILMPD